MANFYRPGCRGNGGVFFLHLKIKAHQTKQVSVGDPSVLGYGRAEFLAGKGSGCEQQHEWNQRSRIFDYTLSMGRRTLVLFLAIFTLTAEEKVNLSVIQRIKAEAFENSQAMDHLFYLADVYGPRLTNSPAHRAAADWVVNRLQSYRLQHVR